MKVTVCQAVSIRIRALLKDKKMTQYRLEKTSGIQHGTMNSIISARYKSVELNTVMIIADGFGISLIKFLDDPVFTCEELELE